MPKKTKGRPDLTFLIICAALIVFGIFMLSSVSSTLAFEYFNNPFYFLKHQIFFGLLPGLALGLTMFVISPSFFKRWALLLFLINLIVIIGVILIPGWGVRYGGATRWLDVGLSTFQPSELLKLTFILYLAALLTSRMETKDVAASVTAVKKKRRFLPSNWRETIPGLSAFLILCAVVVFFLYKQPDFSTLAVVIATGMTMYFAANAPLWHIIPISVLIGGAFWLLVTQRPYALNRIKTLLNQNLDILGHGYQTWQSLLAIGSGGIFGLGYGLSRQKFGFLPEAMSDTIFSIISEELGFFGGAILVLIFLVFLWKGIDIAKKAPDKFSQLVAVGITFWIVFQAFINIGSIIGIIPTTGVPLPFISYGGSHLIVELTAVGILLNISRHSRKS